MLAFGSFVSCIARLDRPSADSSRCRGWDRLLERVLAAQPLREQAVACDGTVQKGKPSRTV
jgi:hypothetical protein